MEKVEIRKSENQDEDDRISGNQEAEHFVIYDPFDYTQDRFTDLDCRSMSFSNFFNFRVFASLWL
jgi:hypothetical protein